MQNPYEKRSYNLTAPSSSKGKVAAAMAKLCNQGEIGESLLRFGVSQSSYCLFLTRLMRAQLAKGKTDDQIANILQLVSGGNASAARQALADCTLQWEDVDEAGEPKLDKDGAPTWAKPMSVSAYWEKLGGASSAVNLSDLD